MKFGVLLALKPTFEAFDTPGVDFEAGVSTVKVRWRVSVLKHFYNVMSFRIAIATVTLPNRHYAAHAESEISGNHREARSAEEDMRKATRQLQETVRGYLDVEQAQTTHDKSSHCATLFNDVRTLW